MHFILTNEHRKYFGLKPIINSWKMEIYNKTSPSDNDSTDYYVYYEQNNLKKVIRYKKTNDGHVSSMEEIDTNYITNDEHTIIYPKTDRGKERKITPTVLDSLSGYGNYFYIGGDCYSSIILIGNYTTQRTYYYYDDYKITSEVDMKNWCENYINNATAKDLEEVQAFANAKRIHVNFKEGDYFRYEVKKHLYMYGRIQLDYYKRKKKGLIAYNPYMGRPVIAELFHIITDRKDLTIEELEKLDTFPSCPVMDNNFYYGDFEIIGHKNLPDNAKYPIICAFLNGKICFQCGNVYKELADDTCPDFCQYKYSIGGVGYYFYGTYEIYRKCIEEKSNDTYWKNYGKCDLRAPQNKTLLKKVLKRFDEMQLFDIYK